MGSRSRRVGAHDRRRQTFCPYKGLCSYYDIGDAPLAAWSNREAYTEVGRISDFVSFEPDVVSVQIDGARIHLAPGQSVIAHGPDRDLTVANPSPKDGADRRVPRAATWLDCSQ